VVDVDDVVDVVDVVEVVDDVVDVDVVEVVDVVATTESAGTAASDVEPTAAVLSGSAEGSDDAGSSPSPIGMSPMASVSVEAVASAGASNTVAEMVVDDDEVTAVDSIDGDGSVAAGRSAPAANVATTVGGWAWPDCAPKTVDIARSTCSAVARSVPGEPAASPNDGAAALSDDAPPTWSASPYCLGVMLIANQATRSRLMAAVDPIRMCPSRDVGSCAGAASSDG
jgi:hypothetical protein